MKNIIKKNERTRRTEELLFVFFRFVFFEKRTERTPKALHLIRIKASVRWV